MFRRVVVVAAALAVALAGRAVAEGDLGIGDAAPKLEVAEFVKGEAVKSLDKEKIYVVEFWATWCGPCRATIPHLTELQKKHKDVVFIGVSVFERDKDKVKPFVKEMGDKMDYRVATDDVSDGEDKGKMAVNWMTAAGQEGIPTAFIVQGGKIAWIGHPADLDKPLAKVVDGKWDLKAAKEEAKAAKARQAKMKALIAKLREAREAKDPKKLLEVLDEAIKDDAGLEKNLGLLKLHTLKENGDLDKAAEYGERLVDKVLEEEKGALNALAWGLVEKPGDKPNAKLMKLALKAAQKADKLADGKDPAVADTLAKAYFENGEKEKALETQERAIKMAKGTPQENDEELQERLETYKKALKKKE